MNNLSPQRLFKIEILITVFSLLVSLSSIAQSGLQSGKPNWLPSSRALANQTQTTPFYVSADNAIAAVSFKEPNYQDDKTTSAAHNVAQTTATLVFNPIPDQAYGGGPIDVSGYAVLDGSSNPIDFSIEGGTSLGTTINQDGTVLNLGGTGTVVVKARVKDGNVEQPYLTKWTKGLKFNGHEQFAKQVGGGGKNAITKNSGTATNNSDNSKTSADTNARPWATAVVFKSNGDNSEGTDQYIWNNGLG